MANTTAYSAFLVVFRLGTHTKTWTRFAANREAALVSALRVLEQEYGALAKLIEVVPTSDPRR
jgi:hypothetical protein